MEKNEKDREPTFSDVGRIGAKALKVKKDKKGFFITNHGRKSSLSMARFFMGLVFVYYKEALVELAKQDSALDMNQLTLDMIMEQIDTAHGTNRVKEGNRNT